MRIASHRLSILAYRPAIYAQCTLAGTDEAYRAMRACYAVGTRCAMSDTDVAYGVCEQAALVRGCAICYERATRCPVLTQRIVLPAKGQNRATYPVPENSEIYISRAI
eukprot:804709-Rhodomonas_salina.3